MSGNWLLYGANGYTGELIAREAVKRGMRPILAGRSQVKVAKLAQELQCPSAAFRVDDHTALVSAIQNCTIVLNCAGPFSATARSIMQACLATHVHYLDITGEIEVFELAQSVDEKARRAGVILCPGVGFDVVPTDSVAVKLKQALPDATHLALGFESRSGLSRGTAKTAMESLGEGSKVRREGRIEATPLAVSTRRIDFGNGERLAVGIPWGDVSTAFYSTGIPNIEVFTSISPDGLKRQQRMNLFRPMLRSKIIQSWLKRRIERRLKPPDQTQRENNPTYVWGEARNAAGQVKTARLRTPNGYALTVSASLGILEHLLADPHCAGSITPTMLVGPDFVTTLPGCSDIRIEP
jgi:short subunit dehydrogenase-like uncharacterized protein